MSNRNHGDLLGRALGRVGLSSVLGLALCWSVFPPALAAGEIPKAAASKRVAVGKCVTETGTLLRREAPGKAWEVVAAKETLFSGDLLVGLPGALLDSGDGAVRLAFLTDLGGQSPFPVKEAAVVLQDGPGMDLEFTLNRGRVNLINHKETGAARVRIHVREAAWDLTLSEPGTSIALELFGKWPQGVPFTKNPGAKDVPTADLTFLVLKGRVVLGQGGYQHAMTAPPGPALIEWDSVSGQDETPRRLEALPPWAVETQDTPAVKEKKEVIEKFRRAASTRPIGDVLDEFVNSEDQRERKLAVYVMGALDDLGRLGQTLREAKHADVWDDGVLAFRHWIGRGPGQDQVLYKRLVEAQFSPADAGTVLQLLHSFDENELAEPATYQALLDFLDHDKLPIRGLAYWHLHRLAPAGEKFGYDPTAPKEKREAAIAKWKKLIPPDQLPPRPGADSGK